MSDIKANLRNLHEGDVYSHDGGKNWYTVAWISHDEAPVDMRGVDSAWVKHTDGSQVTLEYEFDSNILLRRG
jgi:hypothetical protein